MRVSDVLAIRLLPTEKEGSPKRRSREVDQAALNVAKLNATLRNAINARLHLINERADAHFNE